MLTRRRVSQESRPPSRSNVPCFLRSTRYVSWSSRGPSTLMKLDSARGRAGGAIPAARPGSTRFHVISLEPRTGARSSSSTSSSSGSASTVRASSTTRTGSIAEARRLVMRGLVFLRRRRELNILCTVNAANEKHGRTVYRFFRAELVAEEPVDRAAVLLVRRVDGAQDVELDAGFRRNPRPRITRSNVPCFLRLTRYVSWRPRADRRR